MWVVISCVARQRQSRTVLIWKARPAWALNVGGGILIYAIVARQRWRYRGDLLLHHALCPRLHDVSTPYIPEFRFVPR